MSLVLIGCLAIALMGVAGAAFSVRRRLDRRGRRRAAKSITTGSSLPPQVAASLDRARRRAQVVDAEVKDLR